MVCFEDEIDLETPFQSHFSFKNNKKYVSIRKDLLFKEMEREQPTETSTVMKYKTLIKKCPGRKDDVCIFCHSTVKEEMLIINLCKNFHFLCLDCKEIPKESKKCFICQQTIKSTSPITFSCLYQGLMEKITEKAEKYSLINLNNLPTLFYVENHVKIIIEDTSVSTELFTVLPTNTSVQFITRGTVTLLCTKECKSLRWLFSNIVKSTPLALTRRTLDEYKKIDGKYSWLCGNTNNVLEIIDKSKTFCEFIEITSFWELNDSEVGRLSRLAKKHLDIQSLKQIVKEKLSKIRDFKPVVLCFIDNIGVLFHLKAIKKYEEKTYLVIPTNESYLFFVSSPDAIIPSTVYLYTHGKSFYTKGVFSKAKEICFIDNKKASLELLIKKKVDFLFTYVIERQIDMLTLQEIIKKVEEIVLFCDKKKHLESLLALKNKSIRTDNLKKLVVRDCSVCILPKLAFSEEGIGLLECTVSTKQQLDQIIKPKSDLLATVKTTRLVLCGYFLFLFKDLPFFQSAKEEELPVKEIHINVVECMEELLKNGEISIGYVHVVGLSVKSLALLSILKTESRFALQINGVKESINEREKTNLIDLKVHVKQKTNGLFIQQRNENLKETLKQVWDVDIQEKENVSNWDCVM